VREIRGKTRKKYSPGEKIQIGLEGLRGEESILALGSESEIMKRLHQVKNNEPIYRQELARERRCRWSK
jgi:hypothetical protein